ncbi:MAG TPA: HAD family hydrolase [Lachnospiraceae bacterium]|nr:HAD family hydrolase [Lachnospiraceae bacterium]
MSIRVIASDLDGTLLNENHELDQIAYETLVRAEAAGIRFITATGRNYPMTLDAFGKFDVRCEYILASGAETRNRQGDVVESLPLSSVKVREIADALEPTGIPLIYNTAGKSFLTGETEKVRKGVIYEAENYYSKVGNPGFSKEELIQKILSRTVIVSAVDDILQPVYKISINTGEKNAIGEMRKKLTDISGLAVASSFPNNIEITDEKAQKGPVLERYIHQLGYTMEDVIVFGDSMNDYSMMCMEFGCTVAPENADPRIKAAAKMISPPNTEHGVVRIIEKILEGTF